MNLPVDIFKDADEGIDQEETININLVEVRDEKGLVVDSSFISLDNKDMKLRGNTKGEALDTVDGEKSWVVSLKAEDRAGLSEYLDVRLVLQRNAPESYIHIPDKSIGKKEGETLSLGESFSVVAQDVIGHKVEVEVIHEARNGQALEMFDSEGKTISPIKSAETGNTMWKFDGGAKYISEQISGIYFSPRDEANLVEDFKIIVRTISLLGETNLINKSEEKSFSVKFEPQPEVPIWQYKEEFEIPKEYEIKTLGDYLEARSPDLKEEIKYIIIGTDEETQFEILDSKGENIGEKDNDRTVLTSDEWENATIRGLSNDEKMIKLRVIAQSKEQSNGLTANSEALTLDWKVTPVIDDEGYDY